MRAIEKIIRGGVALALGALLVVSAAPAVARAETVGAFEVTGGTQGEDYSYSNGVLTVNNGADITISMAGGATTPTSDRIAVNGNANITLNGVNITPVDAVTNDGYSGIDLASGVTLNITLQNGSSNVINGGTSVTGTPGPGIHVPEGSTLTVGGEGSFEVNGTGNEHSASVGIGGMASASEPGEACGNVILVGGTIIVRGGTDLHGRSAVDIGGGYSDAGAGGDCDTVIILTPVNSGGGLVVGGGAGAGAGGNKGADGAGIKPVGDGNYTVYGDLTLPCDITIPAGATVVIPEGASLTVPEGVELTNNGTIKKDDGGSFINDGTVTGQQPADDRYTIDYEKETISIAEGFALYDEATGGTQIQSGSSITAYIGKSLYLQKSDSEDSGLTQISIPARPSAPGTTEINISYSDEKLTIAPDEGISAGYLEYTTQSGQANRNWIAVPESLALSEMGWTGSQMTLYFRVRATETSFASEATTTGKEVPSRPTAPGASCAVTAKTENSITISAVSGQEYRCGAGDTWSSWQTGTDSVITFGNLTPGTGYTIQNRYPHGQDASTYQEQFASFANSTAATTLPSITTGSLDVGYVGVPYSAQLSAGAGEGKTVTWSLAEGSSLPAGLTLSESGSISGTPTAAGTSTFAVLATIDGTTGEGQVSSTKELSVTINAGTPVITISSGSGAHTYGDIITVSGSIAASGEAPGNGINALSEPAQNEVGLYLGETQLATANVGDDGAFTLTYSTSEKGITPGDAAQNLTVRYGGSSDLIAGEVTVQVTLKPKTVEAVFDGPLKKAYDGTAAAPTGLVLKLQDVLSGDDVSVACDSITFDNADVDEDKTITAAGITLGGNDAKYYSLSNATATTSGSITKSGSALTVEPSTTSLTYGDTLTLTVTPAPSAANAVSVLTAQNAVELYNGDVLLASSNVVNDDGSYTLTYDTAGRGLAVGSNTLTVSYGGSNNMLASTASYAVSLSAKPVTASMSGTPSKTFDEKTDVEVALTFADGVLVGEDSLSGTVGGSFPDANVGEGKLITLGTDPAWSDPVIAGYYDITLPDDVTGSIMQAQIGGKLTISGTPAFGETLTAVYEASSGETVTYQWRRGGEDISDATEETYALTAEDVGAEVSVVATAMDGNHTGNVTSSSVTVGKAGQVAPAAGEGYAADFAAETVAAESGYELAGAADATEGSASLAAVPGATVYVRLAETNTHLASGWTALTLPARPAAPEVTGGTLVIKGVTTAMEWSSDGGATWQRFTDETVARVPAGTYLVRLTATTDAFAGEPTAEISVRNPYVPPAQTGVDWDEVVAKIEGSGAGGRVTVDMDGETVLPGEVLGALAGRDVTLVLQMDDGVAWEIHGGDVPEGTPFSDVDMGVELGTSGIPVEVVSLVTGESGSVQVALAHDGEFGFALTLVAPLGEKYEGLFANLYRYDGAAGVLRYEAAGVVDDEGAARVRLDHASQWLVALDTRLHALPFADADEGQWYSEPVRWAWLSGAMGGYGDGSGLFGTDDALTRAQMAAVLYNLAGKPDVEFSGLPADCDEGEWYARAVAWALSEGIFGGYGDGSGFGPDDPLSREQAAAVLYNAAGRPGAGADLSSFSDAGEASSWARNALSWAVSEGVLSGVELPDGSRELQPGRACTRSEIAALMMNLARRG